MRGAGNTPPAGGGFSIKARLAVMLVLFGLVPSLVVTYVASRRIAGSLELMKSPGVTRTLDGAFETTRDSLRRLEASLQAACAAAAAAAELTRGAQREAPDLSAALDRYGVDYVSLYTRTGSSGWTLAAEAMRRPTDYEPARGGGAYGSSLPPKPELPRPLAQGLHYDPNGWLVDAVYAAPGDEEPRAMLAMGYYMGPSFFARVGDVATGIGYYRKLDVLKDLYVRGIWVWAGLLLLVVSAATFFTARWAASGLSKPLVDLADGMTRVARGEEGVVVSPRGSRETRFLAGAFNSMVEELARYRRELASAERAAAWRDVARVVAHEIRNPLTPIQFAVRRIRQRLQVLPAGERDELNESLDSIVGEVEALKGLASSFSQFAKLPEPKPAPTDVNKLVAEVADLFGRDGQATLEVELDGSLPRAFADASQLRMTLNNLLKNAMEATGAGGKITVRTRSSSSAGRAWVVLQVRDTGAGMDEETLSKATAPYFSTKSKGSGLGLAVVHRIVSQHGGVLEIESARGKGTTVTVHLPAAQ